MLEKELINPSTKTAQKNGLWQQQRNKLCGVLPEFIELATAVQFAATSMGFISYLRSADKIVRLLCFHTAPIMYWTQQRLNDYAS